MVDLGGGVGLQLRHKDPHNVEQEDEVDLDKKNHRLNSLHMWQTYMTIIINGLHHRFSEREFLMYI